MTTKGDFRLQGFITLCARELNDFDSTWNCKIKLMNSKINLTEKIVI